MKNIICNAFEIDFFVCFSTSEFFTYIRVLYDVYLCIITSNHNLRIFVVILIFTLDNTKLGNNFKIHPEIETENAKQMNI